MEQVGFVTNVNEDMAKVVIKRVSACGDSCASCGSNCSTLGVTLDIKNTLCAKPGDYVELKSHSSQILRTAAIVYLFPLLVMIAGIAGGISVFRAAGYENYETYGFFIGLIFLGLSFIAVRKIDKRAKKNNSILIEMTRIIMK